MTYRDNMRSSYTLGPLEIQAAVIDWLRDHHDLVVEEESIAITFSVHDVGEFPAKEMEATWGEPE